MEYLENSMYKDQLPNAGLYYEQLADRGKVLKALNTPKLGDSLLKPDGTPWMADLEHMAPKLNWDDLTQTPALPLGSWLKTDPWDDKVHMLNAKRYAPMNARDKMPFEVTPIFYKLQRYEEASAEPARAAPTVQRPAHSRRTINLRLYRITRSRPHQRSQAAAPLPRPTSRPPPAARPRHSHPRRRRTRSRKLE